MNKQELATVIAQYDGVTQKEAIRRIDQIFTVITHQLTMNDAVKLRGFGTFATALRSEKTITNPKTKKTITVPERNVPTFTPSKVLRDKVQHMKEEK